MLQEPRFTDERPDETNAALMPFRQAGKAFIALDIPPPSPRTFRSCYAVSLPSGFAR